MLSQCPGLLPVVCISSDPVDSIGSQEDQVGSRGGPSGDSILDQETLVPIPSPDVSLPSLAVPSLSSSFEFTPSVSGVIEEAEIGGLAFERMNLESAGVSSEVAVLLQQSRKPTLKSYGRHWRNFVPWCSSRALSPFHCDPVKILDFLREGFLLDLAVSSLRSQWAAIQAFYGVCGFLHCPIGI